MLFDVVIISKGLKRFIKFIFSLIILKNLRPMIENFELGWRFLLRSFVFSAALIGLLCEGIQWATFRCMNQLLSPNRQKSIKINYMYINSGVHHPRLLGIWGKLSIQLQIYYKLIIKIQVLNFSHMKQKKRDESSHFSIMMLSFGLMASS